MSTPRRFRHREPASSFKTKQSSLYFGGFASKLSVRKNNKKEASKDAAKGNAAAAAAATRSNTPSSTDSSSRGCSSNGSVGSHDRDLAQQKMAETAMIQYFEDSTQGDASSKDERQKTGPIDLDLLEDNFHYYDEDRLDAFLESTVDTGSSQEKIEPKQQKEAPFDEPQEDSQSIDSIEDYDDDDETQNCPDDESTVGDLASSPVDMDDILDLETAFDSILDAHEDNFDVWEANRQTVNKIQRAEERAERNGSKYGQSLRRQRGLSRWSS